MTVFSGHRINASWRVAAFLLSRPGLVARNGLSLARNDSRLRETHSGVNGPGLLLRSLLPGSTARSALLLRYRNAGSPRLRPPHRFWPVTASPNSPAGCASCLHSPPGLLPPSGSKRSAEFAACQARLPNPPDFLSLPAARFLSLDFLAADHRSRSAPFPEACCSSNLLEPLSLCPHNGLWSILF